MTGLPRAAPSSRQPACFLSHEEAITGWKPYCSVVLPPLVSAPAGFVMAKIMLPETETPREETVSALLSDERTTRNVIDAAAAARRRVQA